MAEPAPAKINLFLHVTGRRSDGYHLLDSLAVFAGAADRLIAEPADALSLTLEGAFAKNLAAEPDNLVLRAARALATACGLTAGARLRLEKNLPVASGMGGGSADAAATLRALLRLWDAGADRAGLHRIAVSLGADVPVCLDSLPRRMAGIGDLLLPAPSLPECGIALVNPGVAVATADVFRTREPGFSAPAALVSGWPNAETMAADLRHVSNDLEAPARALCPPIDGVLAALSATPGALLARMSGSGATCFALYPTAARAAAAAASLRRPGWWCWGGGLFQPEPVLV